MSTPAALAMTGVTRIRRQRWKEGVVYIENYTRPHDTWCFVHPTNVPDPRPLPLVMDMLPGDDWEEWQPAEISTNKENQ